MVSRIHPTNLHCQQVAAELPATSALGAELTDAFLNGLWNDLKHPPIAYAATKDNS